MATRWQLTVVALCALLVTPFTHADITRWDTGEVIPGTEGIEPGPRVQLNERNTFLRNLQYADLSGGLDLRWASFSSSWLDYANLSRADLTGASLNGYASLIGANLTEADLTGAFLNTAKLKDAEFSGAVVTYAVLNNSADQGLTKEQLYSTASYQSKNLQGLWMWDSSLTGWDLSGQDLTDAVFSLSSLAVANLAEANLTDANLSYVTLTGANLTGAVVNGAGFRGLSFGGTGISREQLYSTASYQSHNLQGIILGEHNLTGWDFSGQDLRGAGLWDATLTNVNLSGANLSNANLRDARGLSSTIFSQETVYNQWTRFTTSFDPEAAGLTLRLSLPGDFDSNDQLDVVDVNQLAVKMHQSSDFYHEMYDLNGDGVIWEQDLDIWVRDLKHTWYGDANLDGEFNSSDMVQVFAAGKYEKSWVDHYGRRLFRAGWSEGDWNADGIFDSGDMVTAFVDGGYEKGPRTPVVAVPEPTSAILLLGSLVVVATRRRRFDF